MNHTPATLLDRAKQEGVAEQEGWRVRKDGTQFWADVVITALRDEAGKLLGFAKITRDVTERRNLEQELRNANEFLEHRVSQRTSELAAVNTQLRSRQSEISALNASLEARVAERTAELVRTNSELEAFSYSVSHDLRTPLRHVDGFARILKEEYVAELPAEGHRFLERILSSTTHMGHLIDDLLNLARIGRKEIKRADTQMTHLVKQALSDLRPEEDRTIEWRVDLLPTLNCDPGLIKLVFINLLANASKFTRTRPSAVIEVGSCLTDGIFTLFVRDNGVGFDPKYADKLFGVFQRLHRQEDFEGTGIGLATVQRIIHRHGGRIWAELLPVTALLSFLLWARSRTQLSRTKQWRSNMAEPFEIEILLVEDNMADAELALHAFKKNKIANHVLHLQDGAEALDFLFSRGAYHGQASHPPRICAPRSETSQNRRPASLEANKEQSNYEGHSRYSSNFFQRRA